MSESPPIVSVPKKYTYLLPPSFDGSIFDSFVHGTSFPDPEIKQLFQTAAEAPFISYDAEFLSLLGNPTIELVEERDTNFAGEAGVWIPSRNEVWYTTWINDGPTHIEILDLNTKTTRVLAPSEPLCNPNGGYYHKGLMYFTCLRDDARNWPGGVISIDPKTGHVEHILNSYFGLKFEFIDDLCWVTSPSGNDFMYFTILPYPDSIELTNTLPQGLWRWDPQTESLLPVISRTELPIPNGIRPSKDGKSLWITDFGGAERAKIWGLPAKVGSPAIYQWHLDGDMWPSAKRIFGVARMQAPDGIRIDDAGRVWTAEGEGIVVRAKDGRILGLFNAHYFTRDPIKVAIVQFELVRDMVVILGHNKLWIVNIGEVVNAG